MLSEEDKLYYQTLIATTTEEDKYDVVSGSLMIFCTSEFDEDLHLLSNIISSNPRRWFLVELSLYLLP